jgi:hypothetical protein
MKHSSWASKRGATAQTNCTGVSTSIGNHFFFVLKSYFLDIPLICVSMYPAVSDTGMASNFIAFDAFVHFRSSSVQTS